MEVFAKLDKEAIGEGNAGKELGELLCHDKSLIHTDVKSSA